jgi:O-methyltransferase involved in polyketide biosynthesis
MSEIDGQDLSGVAETLLITLYLRAMQSQRPDALIKDEEAVELVTRLTYDFARVRRIRLSRLGPPFPITSPRLTSSATGPQHQSRTAARR